MNKIKTSRAGKNPRILKNGAMASAITAMVVAAVILINLIVNALPSQYTQFDMSHQGLYTLGDASLALLHGLESDVTAYYLAPTGGEDTNITALLDRYAGQSGHFRWEQKDPTVYPTFAGQYGAEQASMGSIILDGGERTQVVDGRNLYRYDMSQYYYNGSYTAEFDGENQISSALMYVSGGDLPTLYTLEGHGELPFGSRLASAMETQNIRMQPLNLVSAGTVPADADAVAINVPTNDLSTQDLEALLEYVKAGGNLLVATSAMADTPNLDALLAEYGVSRQAGLVIEGDADYCASGFANYLMPTVRRNDVTEGLEQGVFVLAPLAQAVLTEEREDVETQPLLTTSSKAYNKLGGIAAENWEKAEGDAEGPFDLAVAATRSFGEDSRSRLVYLASEGLLDAGMDGLVSGGNSQFLLSCASWLGGQQTGMLIAAKSLDTETLVIPQGPGRLLGGLFVIVLPLCILAFGAVVTMKRRKL